MPEITLDGYDSHSLKGFLRFLQMLAYDSEEEITAALAKFFDADPPSYGIRAFCSELTRFRTALGDKSLSSGPAASLRTKPAASPRP